ncbi:MAG: PKD domain-containing protein [Bacteroidales bacterium]|nr:PKD domain-containing protein [Bacteroidales bacterium]
MTKFVYCSSMNIRLTYKSLLLPAIQWADVYFILVLLTCFSSSRLSAEGTKQLEPVNAPLKSYCRISLTNNTTDYRIPFALVGCDEVYRLNINIKDYTKEKIYLGFGEITNYFEDTSVIISDVKFQVRNPDDIIVPGFSLKTLPDAPGEAGFILTRDEAIAGPEISGSNLSGYSPLIIIPDRNGDYYIEFEIPSMEQTEARVFKYFDITVASGVNPLPGRMWSKTWQLSSSNVDSEVNSSHSIFYIYSDDGIVTSFDCNGLAGGIWAIYSNEYGCSTAGNWSERRRSIIGNATVSPQYKIFLNDPDPSIYPSGQVGTMNSFDVITADCDTLIIFTADVSKKGNIEILLDLPPSNPGTVGVEDVQLGYPVVQGTNILLPGWDGMSAIGKPIPNGTIIGARIRYLNGLSNLPLFDVEDNPLGFKVDIQRPIPISGISKMKVYWDDLLLPSAANPTINTTLGCIYVESAPVSGCHEWTIESTLGDKNTINSWWYYSTDEVLSLPFTINMGPSTGNISGPDQVCFGQSAIFRTQSIPHAEKYIWELTGPGVSMTFEKTAPDTTLYKQFSNTLQPGVYSLIVKGSNQSCGIGPSTNFTIFVYNNLSPPISGPGQVCANSTSQFAVNGAYTNISWLSVKGTIQGPADLNIVNINWSESGIDTLKVITTNVDCGTRTSIIPIIIKPSPTVEFEYPVFGTTCLGVEAIFADQSHIQGAIIVSRTWDWGDGNTESVNGTNVIHNFKTEGNFNVTLRVSSDQGCHSETSHNIRVIPLPQAEFSVYQNCISDSVQFTDHSVGENINQWHWSFPVNATVVNPQLSAESRAIFNTTGTFPVRLVATNLYGCSDTISKDVKIHEHPQADFSMENPCQNQEILFTDESSPADTLIENYKWKVTSTARSQNTYEGNPVKIIFEDAQTYTLVHEITDFFGCKGSITSLIPVNPTPESLFESTDNYNNINGLLTFSNQSNGATEYSWDFGNGETSSLFEPEIKYNQEGSYTIIMIASNAEGCYDTAYWSYYYTPGLYLPNAFSPDQNGKNDVFKPISQSNSLTPYSLQIFNQWGLLIFESNDPGWGWDGTFRGEPCSMGDYIYLVKYNETHESESRIIHRKGIFTLVR